MKRNALKKAPQNRDVTQTRSGRNEVELNVILFIVIAVLVIGGILFRYLVWDKKIAPKRRDKKKSEEGEIHEER